MIIVKYNSHTNDHETLESAAEGIADAVVEGGCIVKEITDNITGKTYSCVWKVYLEED